MDVCKSLNISNVTVMKNPEILKFVSNWHKTIKMCKNTVKKLPYLLRYFPDQQYKTQPMCNKAILENGGKWSASDCHNKAGEMDFKVVEGGGMRRVQWNTKKGCRLSTTMVSWQEKYLIIGHSRMAKTIIFWPWW